MKGLVEYITEGKLNIDIADLKKRANNIKGLDSKNEKDFDVLNTIAMDLLDVVWHDHNIETKEWKELYNMYHVAFDTWMNKKYDACTKHFREMIEATLEVLK